MRYIISMDTLSNLSPSMDSPTPISVRHRMAAGGVAALTDAELLIALGVARNYGTAQTMLSLTGSLFTLVYESEGYHRFLGMTERRSLQLTACGAVAARLAESRLPQLLSAADTPALVAYLALRYWRPGQEVMGAAYLNTRRRLLGDREIFLGTLHRIAVDPRTILLPALLLGASGVILFHTHPSGVAKASREDHLFTGRMEKACDVFGLELLDHLVIGGPNAWDSIGSRGFCLDGSES
jgi:DNA repair protein RadC